MCFRYVCPCCLKSLNNVPAVVALKTTGSVFCKSCYSTILAKDLIDPVTNTAFTDDDVFNLESEATSYSGRAGAKSVAKKVTDAPRFG